LLLSSLHVQYRRTCVSDFQCLLVRVCPTPIRIRYP
jgi:hypothetical protein